MRYTIGNEKLDVIINSKGAELQSVKSKDGVEYLWQGDPSYWVGQAPNLFPYIGGLTEGKYYFEGLTYEMAKHGFARVSEFNLTGQKENKLIFALESNAFTREQYPFEFTIYVIYELQGKKLEVTYVVENRDEKTMYFALGGHPGFYVPLESGLAFEDFYLEFTKESETQLVGMSEDGYVTGEDQAFLLEDGRKLPLRHDLFDHDAIILKGMCKEVTLKSDKSERQVTVTYPKMDYLGIWHMPRTDAPYVCIEPWTSLPSRKNIIESLETKADMIELLSKQIYTNTWQLEIQ